MSVATSYARALYEASRDAKATSETLNQTEQLLSSIVSLVESSKEIRVAFYSPVATAQEKTAIVGAVCQKLGFPTLLSQFMAILARKGRLRLLAKIRDEFTNVRLNQEGGVPGTMVSAETVEAGDIEGLAKAFSLKLGKKVAFKVSTDASLLAGVKVTVNGVTYDGTLRAQLNRLRDRLVMNGSNVLDN